MAKLYFKYGVMGSSKSAQALITKFNYEEQGMRVWLIKPAKDTSYGLELVRSRIGLEEKGDAFGQEVDLFGVFQEREKEFYEVIIVDDAQFLAPSQVEQLRDIVDIYNVPVLCFGLRTDFRTKLFPGSNKIAGTGRFYFRIENNLCLWQKGYSKCQTRSRGQCDYPRGTGLFGRA